MIKEIQTGAVKDEILERQGRSREEAAAKEKESLAKAIGKEVEDLEATGNSAEDFIGEIYSQKAKEAEKTDKGKGILEIIGLKKTALEKAEAEKKNMAKGLEYITGGKKFAGEKYIKGIDQKYETLNKLLQEHDKVMEMEGISDNIKKSKELEVQISEFLKFMSKEPNVSRYGWNAEKEVYEDRTKYAL